MSHPISRTPCGVLCAAKREVVLVSTHLRELELPRRDSLRIAQVICRRCGSSMEQVPGRGNLYRCVSQQCSHFMSLPVCDG